MGAVEIDECITNLDATLDRVVAQDLVVAGREFVERVLLVGKTLVQLMQAPVVGLQVLLVLRVDGTQLAVQRVFEEQRVDEELGKAIEGAVQRGLRLLNGQRVGAGERRGLTAGGGGRGRELKVVVCVARGGEGVRVAAVSLQVLVVFVLDGKLQSQRVSPPLAMSPPFDVPFLFP